MEITPFELVVRLTRAQSTAARKIDRTLSTHGLSFSDLLILLHLESAPGRRLRRVDLAEMMGMTASGVTRALVPLERIGLLVREANPRDARVAYAAITRTGRRFAREARETAEDTSTRLFAEHGAAGVDLAPLAALLERLGGTGITAGISPAVTGAD